MTESRFDRRVQGFIADGPTSLADRVLDAALDDVHRTRQRRRWRGLGTGQTPLPAARRFGGVLGAATVIVAVVALSLSTIGPSLMPAGAQASITGRWTTNGGVALTMAARPAEPRQRYLAAVVYDAFDGQGWALGAPTTVLEREAGERLPSDSPETIDASTRREITMTFEPVNAQQVVYAPGLPVRIDSPVRAEVVGEGGFLARIVRDPSREPYTVTSLVPAPEDDGGPTKLRLRLAGTDYPDGIRERFGMLGSRRV